MQDKIPHLQNATLKGALLVLAGVILILHVTGIITRSLDMIILLGAILMIAYGLIKMDAYNKLVNVLNRKK